MNVFSGPNSVVTLEFQINSFKRQKNVTFVMLLTGWGGFIPIISFALFAFLTSVVGLTLAFLCCVFTSFFLCTNIITPTFRDGFCSWCPIQFETCKWTNIIHLDEFLKNDGVFAVMGFEFWLLFVKFFIWFTAAHMSWVDNNFLIICTRINFVYTTLWLTLFLALRNHFNQVRTKLLKCHVGEICINNFALT